MPLGNKVTWQLWLHHNESVNLEGRCRSKRLILRASGSLGSYLRGGGRTYRFQPYNFIWGRAAVQCFFEEKLDKR